MTTPPLVGTDPPPWWNSLRPGSFREVPFFTKNSDFEGGRRGTVLEFPRQNEPKTQDLGRMARRFTVEALVIGEEYHLAKQLLIDALEQGGPGKLVHRYYGEFLAELEPGRPFRVTESDEFGGSARFSIPFIRIPETKPKVTLDTVTVVASSAATAKKFSLAAFTKKFLVDGPEFIRDHAMSVINEGITQVNDLNNQVSGALGAINQVNQAIKQFGGVAAQLISTPGRLAELGAGGFGLHEAIFTSVGAVANAYKSNLEAFGRIPQDTQRVAREESRKIATVLSLGLTLGSTNSDNLQPITGTASRAVQRANNQAAWVRIMQQSAVISAATTALDVSFESNAAALAMRDQLTLALDAQAEKCDDDDTFSALQDLRVDVSRHLTAVAGEAPKLRDFYLATTLPALLVAHLAHGDASRADELIARNNIRHPGFVPGGAPVKILVET